jgi:hypothetical protein
MGGIAEKTVVKAVDALASAGTRLGTNRLSEMAA